MESLAAYRTFDYKQSVLHAPMHKITENVKKIVNPLVLRSLPRISTPVFILSAPRSGSTHLYEILRRCESVASLNEENDSFWWSLFPYSRLDHPSDFISASEINAEFATSIRTSLALHVTRRLYKQNFFRFLKLGFFGRESVYLEKTVANCFHLEALAMLFPEAKYIHLVRDGRATVSSMIEGWKSKQFMRRTLPFPNNSSIDYWTFPIPPGWESITHAGLNKICAWSWLEHNRYILDFFEVNPALKINLIQVSYEELVDNTEKTIDSLIEFCGFNKSSQVDSYLEENQSSRTTISAPVSMKWKRGKVNEILEIESSIAPMMARLGYPDVHALKPSNEREIS